MKLSDKKLSEGLKKLRGWKKVDNSIARKVVFKSFGEAVGFINVMTSVAEELIHHPDLELRNYNELTIWLTTHEAGGITDMDLEMAARINRILKK